MIDHVCIRRPIGTHCRLICRIRQPVPRKDPKKSSLPDHADLHMIFRPAKHLFHAKNCVRHILFVVYAMVNHHRLRRLRQAIRTAKRRVSVLPFHKMITRRLRNEA